MKRNTFVILAMLLMAFSLVIAACGPAATTAAPTEEMVETEEPVVEATEPMEEAEPTEEMEETEEMAPTEEAEMEPQPFWSRELRQAVAAAIDREVIVDRVFEGRNTPAYHMVPSDYPYATEPFLEKYGVRNLELSIQILTDLGYTPENPLVMDLWYPPEHYGTTTADVFQVLKEQLEETGLIQVNAQSQNWAEYVDSFVAGELPAFLLGWFPDFVDPDTFLTPFASCLQSPDNGVNYCNEEMDALLLKAASSADSAVREATYAELGTLYAEDVPTIPLWWEPEFIIYRNGVEGVTIGAPFEFSYNVLSFAEGYTPAAGTTDTIIIGTTDEVNSLDPQDAYATHDWEILKNTGLPLMTYVPGTAELVLGTAAELPQISEDGKVYTFKIRQDITFADGTPVNADTYVNLWTRLNTLEGQVSGLMQVYMENLEKVDDYTIAITLKDSFGFFPALAATAPFIPANPATFPADEIVQFPDKLDGIGPYKMVSHVPGEQMVLEANAAYVGDDKPLIPNVIIRYFADPTTMSQAVEKGEIDIAWRTVGPVEAARLQELEGLTVVKIAAPALRYLVFNHTFMK